MRGQQKENSLLDRSSEASIDGDLRSLHRCQGVSSEDEPSALTLMTTTNTSSEMRAHPTPLLVDLGLDALATLHWPNKLAVEDIVVGSRFCGWREQSTAEGEKWLRNSAKNGDWWAMENLGLRLISGDGLEKSRAEGLEWMRRAAEQGSPIAMLRLAECLLDVGPSSELRAEAERWLEMAIDLGSQQATMMLGTRLITGTGLSVNPERGKELLLKAARGGSQLARIKLAVYLLSGRGLAQDREEAFRWLRQVGVTQPSQLQLVNYYLYMKSLTAITRTQTRLLAEEAGVLFYESVQQGNSIDQMNLAYLIRRGEIDPKPYPSLDELLSRHLRQNQQFALINQALRLAKGVECAVDWQLADILVGKIRAADGVLKWWFARSTEGDAEGHLVTGWLVRRQLVLDPEQHTLARRMDLARAGGWEAPEWMSVQAS